MGLSSEKNPILERENKIFILMSYQSILVFIFVKIFKLGQIPKLTNEMPKTLMINFFHSAFIGLIHKGKTIKVVFFKFHESQQK